MSELGARWPEDSNVKLVRTGVDIPSPTGSFGACSYSLYEAYPPGRRFSTETPYLVVWLHGQSDMHLINMNEVATMSTKLNRRLICMAPKNPGKCNGYEFFWGQQFDKKQNQNGLGFVYGSMNYDVMAAFCSAIKQVADESRADRTILGGFSMGGFGAFQFGGYKPDLFDAVFSIAGHGIGTLLPSDQGFHSPQPDGEVAFMRFLDMIANNLSRIPLVLAIHAERDTLSYYKDVALIIEKVQYLGGQAKLMTVPEDKANSDGSKKSKMFHGYYNFALMKDTSDWAFYGPLKAALSSDACVYRREMAEMEASMAQAQAEAAARQMEEMRLKAEAEKKEKGGGT